MSTTSTQELPHVSSGDGPLGSPDDPRLAEPLWQPRRGAGLAVRRLRLIVPLNVVAAVWYFGWLLSPSRIGTWWLYAPLVVAELFNLAQAIGYWWTATRARPTGREDVRWEGPPPTVDVFVPTYDEGREIVEPVLRAASRLRGADVRVVLLDDGGRPEMQALAEETGARYLAREGSEGAKAGNINAALPHTDGQFIAVLDCDHVPDQRFLEATIGHLADESVAFVQTPQYYADSRKGGVAAAAWAQQALFFGIIGRGKDALGAMFCCGTNVVFRREALESQGGFPTESVTEDFELSLRLHEQGWRSVYVPEVLAQGLSPQTAAAYVGQQLRWARGCVGALPRVLRSRLPWRLRLQYLLSSMFFLTGWTVLAYMLFPVVKLVFDLQPVAPGTADAFVAHFLPYFGLALLSVAVGGAGSYTWRAFALQSTSFWIHMLASVRAVLGRGGSFTVTPKSSEGGRQPRAAAPAIAVWVLLVAAVVYGLLRTASPETVNATAFALLHLVILSSGIGLALRKQGGD